MELEKLKMYEEYSELLQMSSFDFKTRGQNLDAVLFFLNNTNNVSKRGYRAFCKQYVVHLILHKHIKKGILHFLSTRGIGYRDSSIKPKKRHLVKLQTSSERSDDAIKGFVEFCKKEYDYSPHTLECYLRSAKDFFMYFNEFTNENVKQYIGHLESTGRSAATIQLRLSGLSMLAKFLHKPITIKRPKRPKKLHTDNIPTEKEYKAICEYLENKPKFLLTVKLMATTGCRVSELLKLTYEQVASGTCVLKGKGGKYRQFFFTKEVQKMAENEIANGSSGVIETITSRGLDSRLKAIGKNVGIAKEKMHPHAFRHFFAKMYLKRTKDVVGLAELLGHDSVDTTKIYLQKSYDEQQKEFNRTVEW